MPRIGGEADVLVNAVVLAAGEGSRMWPFAQTKPKHLLPIAGKPIVSHVLQALSDSYITEVVMVVGFKSEMIRSALGNGDQYGVKIKYAEQPRWTGTASALKVAYDAVGREPFFALYGDLWVNSSAIRAVVQAAKGGKTVMGVVRVSGQSEYGAVELEDDNVVKIIEKPGRANPAEGWINSGIYYFDDAVFQAIKQTKLSRRAEYELTSSLELLLRDGKEIKAAIVDQSDWMDIGRPWDLLEATARAFRGMSVSDTKKGTIEDGAALTGPVWLEESSVIRMGSCIEGPAYVGRGSQIGPNARIRPSTCIGDGVVIGTSCEIKNSVIMRGTKIPHLSYIGDSVIGEECNLGAGTMTANVRFDRQILKMRVKGHLKSTGLKKLGVIMGDNVQTGINTSIMPGRRIGSDTWIGPGVILTEDVPSGFVVLAKQRTTLMGKASGIKGGYGSRQKN